jgi:y4mF family transcriptional regulator
MKDKINIAYGEAIKKIRREAGLTQKDFALRSGLGLHFIRDLEQGYSSLRLDKVNAAFKFFGYELKAEKKPAMFTSPGFDPNVI